MSARATRNRGWSQRAPAERAELLREARRVLTVDNFFTEGGLALPLATRLAKLARRDQLTVVTLFVTAAARYDDAHRPDESTTMDVMLDVVFPRYGSSALRKLLTHFRNVGYMVNDRFIDLFPAAFRSLEAKSHAIALARLYARVMRDALEGERDDVVALQGSLRRVGRHLPSGLRTALVAEIRRVRGS